MAAYILNPVILYLEFKKRYAARHYERWINLNLKKPVLAKLEFIGMISPPAAKCHEVGIFIHASGKEWTRKKRFKQW